MPQRPNATQGTHVPPPARVLGTQDPICLAVFSAKNESCGDNWFYKTNCHCDYGTLTCYCDFEYGNPRFSVQFMQRLHLIFTTNGPLLISAIM